MFFWLEFCAHLTQIKFVDTSEQESGQIVRVFAVARAVLGVEPVAHNNDAEDSYLAAFHQHSSGLKSISSLFDGRIQSCSEIFQAFVLLQSLFAQMDFATKNIL